MVHKSARWASIATKRPAGRLTHISVGAATLITICSCGTKKDMQTLISQRSAGDAGLVVQAIDPVQAKPSDVVKILGFNFTVDSELLARFTLADGTQSDTPITIIDNNNASFVMPDGLGAGFKSFAIISGGVEKVRLLRILAQTSENRLSILFDDPSQVCSTKQFHDLDGTVRTGTKNCAQPPPIPDCASDGATGCKVVSPNYAAAVVAGAASKILSGQSVAGVSGNVTLPEQGKVLTGTNYGVNGSGSSGTLTLPAAANVLAGTANYGDPSAAVTPVLTSRGAWDVSTGFPGAGYYSGTTNTPSDFNIISGTTILGIAGTWTDITSSCTSEGQQTCVATGSYKAAVACTANSSNCYVPAYVASSKPLKAIDFDQISSNAANIRSGTTLSGVAGSLADCSSDGAQGCVTTTSYKAADMTNVSAGNIRSGVTIAGQLGEYPSATYPLPGADADIADLDAATFSAKMSDTTSFEYWTSDGSRQIGTGDGDLSVANVKTAVDIFGTVGTYAGPAATHNAWDVRAGVVVSGLTGKLKVHCRNRINSSRFNYDGAISGIGQAAVTSGTALDIWDTIDDYNNGTAGLPPYSVTGWNSDCGGIEATSGDDNVWKDVTTKSSDGSASDCATDSGRCTMADKITGLWWSKIQTQATWDAAWNQCQTLDHNGQSSGWRLPTQKELLEAYVHGIRSAASDDWITAAQMLTFFWSGSTVSNFTDNAWSVYMAYGYTYSNAKLNSYQFSCVR